MRTSVAVSRIRRVSVALVCLLGLLGSPGWLPADEAAGGERFPVIAPASRAQAVTVLTGGAPLATDCLTPRLSGVRAQDAIPQPAIERALRALVIGTVGADEQRWVSPEGDLWRFSHLARSFGRVPRTDRNDDRVPDRVQRIRSGITEARRLLIEELGLPNPGLVEILLADLGQHVNGYTLPFGGEGGAALLVINVSRQGVDVLTDTAAHQFTHAVVGRMGRGPGPDWAEAIANWSVFHLNGAPTEQVLRLMSLRIARMGEGLFSDDLDLIGGNALWLAFMDESFGATSVGRLAEAMARDTDPLRAIGRAVSEASGQTLPEAFRDFHLWSLLVGERRDGRHFSFAARLPSPGYAAVADGLPSLSVQAEPAVAPWGAAQILLSPEDADGGLSLLFEGALAAEWDADLLLIRDDGSMVRVPVGLNDEGRGELTAPLNRLDQAVLLVRNLSTDFDGGSERYTWSAHHERGFPFELGATRATATGGGVQISWETRTENQVLGFNVIRLDDRTGRSTRITPVWVPAIGDGSTAVTYEFLDTTARPGGRYSYRIEGVTVHGLTSLSEPFPALL